MFVRHAGVTALVLLIQYRTSWTLQCDSALGLRYEMWPYHNHSKHVISKSLWKKKNNSSHFQFVIAEVCHCPADVRWHLHRGNYIFFWTVILVSYFSHECPCWCIPIILNTTMCFHLTVLQSLNTSRKPRGNLSPVHHVRSLKCLKIYLKHIFEFSFLLITKPYILRLLSDKCTRLQRV